MKRWKCSVCGYLHVGDEAPEKCPACGVDKSMFFQVDEDGKKIDVKFAEKVIDQAMMEEPIKDSEGETLETTPVEESVETAVKEAPVEVSGDSSVKQTAVEESEDSSVKEAAVEESEDSSIKETAVEESEDSSVKEAAVEESEDSSIKEAPVGVSEDVSIKEESVQETEKKTKIVVPAKNPVIEKKKKQQVAFSTDAKVANSEIVPSVDKEPEKPAEKKSRSFLDLLGALSSKLHLHPIAVHTPNGIIPMAVFFMVLAIFYNYPVFEEPAFFSLVFVLAVLPFVVFTGYMEWQLRYRGAKTFLFIVKILCSLIVLATVSTLVIWRFVDPAIAGPESPLRMVYLSVGLVSLVAAAIAGHLGGKLVFSGRS